MFISFEGIDGSGKSTQISLLAEALRASGHEVVVVREPGGTALGEKIRDLLLSPGETICPQAELFLFCAARAQLVEERIRPNLEQGAIVIADRYTDSTTAYQFGGRELSMQGEIRTLHNLTTQNIRPDLTILLKAPYELTETRRKELKPDRIEREQNAFFSRVTDAYRVIAQENPDRVIVLNAEESVVDIHRSIIDIIKSREV